nr:hypothetical protein [Paracoccaceae bacterium]
RASGLKDNQAKNIPGKELTARLRKPPVQQLTPLEAAKSGAGRRSSRLRRQVVDLAGEQAPLPLEGGSGASLSTPDSEGAEDAAKPVRGNASA